MSEHTPGRLVVLGSYSIYTADDKTPVADTCLTNSVPDNDEANARRLVAAWNACDGISTDTLELVPRFTEAGIKTVQSVEAERDSLRAVNAELLAALERFASWADSQTDAQSKGGHATFDLMALREERDSARAAIARATAQANTEIQRPTGPLE